MLFNKKNNFKFIKFFSKFLIIILLINTSLETNSLRANTSTSNITCDSSNKPKTCNLSTLYKLVSPLFKDIKPTLSDFKGDYCKYINHQNPANLDTVLMSAAATGQLDTVNALIGCNANPDFKNHKDYTALDFAQSKLSSNPTSNTYQNILNSLKPVTTCRTDVTSDNSCLPGLNNIDCCTGYTCDPTSKTCKSNTPVGPTCAKSGDACTIDSNCCTGLTCQSSKCAIPPAPTCGKETQACCANNVCNTGLTCQSGICSTQPAPTCCKALGDTCDPNDTTCDKTTFTCDPDTKKCKNTPVNPVSCIISGDSCTETSKCCHSNANGDPLKCDVGNTNTCIACKDSESICSDDGDCCDNLSCAKSHSDTGEDTSNVCCAKAVSSYTCEKDNDCCKGFKCDSNNTKNCIKEDDGGLPEGGVVVSSSLSEGATVGIAVGGTVFLIILGVFGVWRVRRYQRKKERGDWTKLSDTTLEDVSRDDLRRFMTLDGYVREHGLEKAITDKQIPAKTVFEVLQAKIQTANTNTTGDRDSTVSKLLNEIVTHNPLSVRIMDANGDQIYNNEKPQDHALITFRYREGETGAVEEATVRVEVSVLTKANAGWISMVSMAYADAGITGPPADEPVTGQGMPSALQRANAREYVTNEWDPLSPSWDSPARSSGTTFDNWKDFANEYPGIARELFGIARYINGFKEVGIDTYRTMVDILVEKNILKLPEGKSFSELRDTDILNLLNINIGLDRNGPLYFPNRLGDSKYDPDNEAYNIRQFTSDEFEPFKAEALQLIGITGASYPTDQEMAEAYYAWQDEENKLILASEGESRYTPEEAFARV